LFSAGATAFYHRAFASLSLSQLPPPRCKSTVTQPEDHGIRWETGIPTHTAATARKGTKNQYQKAKSCNFQGFHTFSLSLSFRQKFQFGAAVPHGLQKIIQ
jgi:hypothetical protein